MQIVAPEPVARSESLVDPRSPAADAAFRRFLASRDPDAFSEFFTATFARLRHQASRLVTDPDSADELVQATFVAALEHADAFDASRRVMPWLLGILHNRARQMRRVRNRVIDAARLQATPIAHDPATTVGENETLRAIRSAIAYLPAPYQPVLFLHLSDGLSPAQISASLRRQRSTVRTQLVRGLRQLRDRLHTSGLVRQDGVVVPTSR